MIKDRETEPFKSYYESNRLKTAVADMEAFYFSEWHSLILKEFTIKNETESEFIALKSVSDCGNEYKADYENAGSRKLAINNLAEVVTTLCCERYDFPPKEKNDDEPYQIINQLVSQKSITPSIKSLFSEDNTLNRDKLLESFQRMIQCFIRTDLVLEAEESLFHCLMRNLLKDNSIVSINGRVGTGKSSFLSFFYEYLLSQKQRVVFWEVPYFNIETQYSITWSQTIFFITQLIKRDPSVILIIDGANVLSSDRNAYDDLIEAIKTDVFHHLCISCGNDISSFDTIWNLVEPKSSINLQFEGICADSKQFNDLISVAIPFFDEWRLNKLSLQSINKFLIQDDPKIISIDYQLLYMIAQQSKSLDNKPPQYMYVFIKRYLYTNYKHNQIDLYLTRVKNLLSSPLSSVPEPSFSRSETFKYNTYAWNYALTTGIYNLLKEDMIESNESKKLDVFLNNELLLPSDINCLLEEQLIEDRNQAKGSNKILDHIIAILSEREISAEAQSQLLYTACKLSYKDDNGRERLKQIAKKTAKEFKKQLKKAHGESKRILSLQYRSVSVILARCGDENELSYYNRLLVEEKDVKYDNLAFHLKYYFRELFSFHDAITLDLNSVYDEMLLNTYYVLEHLLANLDHSNLNSFNIHNLITFLHLCEFIVSKPGHLTGFPNEAKDIICKFKPELNQRNKKNNSSQEDFKRLLALVDSVIKAIIAYESDQQ